MASIFSNLIVLFMLACMSTLSSADQGWFRARNTTFPFSSRHKRLWFPPPPSRWLPQPPWRRLPYPPWMRLPPSPPRKPRTPPPSRRPRTPPSRRPRTPPSRRPRTPPPHLPPLPRRPRTPPPHLPPLPRRPRTPPSPPSPTPQNPRKVIVGGSKYWRLGFDYNDWILKNGPFYLNDILVFKYDRPNRSTPPHNVYLLPNMQSFNKCDFGRAKLVANLTQGSGNGFNFVLKQQKAYYFACGEGNGFHCNIGSMKFSITPQSRRLPSPSPRRPRIPPPRRGPPLLPSSPPPPSKRPRIPPPRQVPPPSPPPPSKRPRIPPPRQVPPPLPPSPPPPSKRPRIPPPRHVPPPLSPSPPPPSKRPRIPPPRQVPPPLPPSPPPPSKRPRIPPPRHVPPPLSPSPPPPSKRPRIPPPRQVPPPSPPPSKRPGIPPPRPMPPLPSPPSPPPSPSPSPSPSPFPSPTPQIPRKIIVGGSERWRLGFDYNDWALKNGPFYLNDILVFKYDRTHSVYSLQNMQSFIDCDFGTAKMVANVTQGSGDGFEFVLNQQNPYYFACGEGNGFHCKLGSMKFSLTPIAQA